MTGKQAVEYGMIASLIAVVAIVVALAILPLPAGVSVLGHVSPCGEVR